MGTGKKTVESLQKCCFRSAFNKGNKDEICTNLIFMHLHAMLQLLISLERSLLFMNKNFWPKKNVKCKHNKIVVGGPKGTFYCFTLGKSSAKLLH